ncbi:RNA polymerase II mediator complex subunit [Ascochyta lentis]
MTSRPGPGIHEQSRGSGVPSRSQVRRRPSKPLNTALPQPIDPALDDARPPPHHAAADTARPLPRGRPQLFYATAPHGPCDPPVHPPFPYQPTATLPLPPRPGSLHLRDASNHARILPGGSGVKEHPTIHAPELVTPPVHFPGGEPADVFPWTGNNPEDTLSEALVKGGISNKPQIMNETNTARPSLWSNLKNKSGLSTLSTLFVAVLEKRQQTGRLQEPNTFKPPPRLTLRDSTREQWLHDLANPAVGVRRLSRTIPHGLTGRVLLEQCLNKNIPLTRALWLAKCVGINELRSHKRKGQAGTVTWVRGWTSSVEQFLDAIVSSMGTGEWKPRITYSVKLATHLYKECLLDVDHFLDWMLHNLEACSSERLFVWLTLLSVPHYWNDILSCRMRGKRLAEALLNHVAKLSQHEASLLSQLLENTLIDLLDKRPACLLLPTTWHRHSVTLQGLADKTNHPQLLHRVQKLDERNRRLQQSSKLAPAASMTSAGRVYRILDNVDYKRIVRIEEVSTNCMEVISNPVRLVSVLLQWTCSHYREGSYRVCLATRLLRRWSHLGADIYECVTTYLEGMSWATSGDSRIVFKVVSELVRSKTFAAGRYMQWLIATGSIAQDLDLSSPDAWPVRLITEIPISGLPDQIRTLRATLLRGTAYSADWEDQSLGHAKLSISQQMPVLCGIGYSTLDHPKLDIGKLGSTVRIELGIWLRQQVAWYAELNEHVPTKDPAVEETATVSLITPHDFHIVRSYLEQFEDLSLLADVVNIATSSLDPSVLASATDTMHYHLKAFRAIGAFDSLFGRVVTRYASIRTIRFPERELLLSLTNLTRTLQLDGQLLQLLNYDLSRLDQKNSMAACSPASDNMGEVMYSISSNAEDEIERILSSGNSMDQQVMARVLRKITGSLQDCISKGIMQSDQCSSWFYRLRSFDDSTFDVVLNEWTNLCLVNHQVEILFLALPTLVGSGCMPLSGFLESLRAYVAKTATGQPEIAFRVASEGLYSLLPSDVLARTWSLSDGYRFRLEQRKLCYEADARVLQFISELIELGTTLPAQKVGQQLSSLLSSRPVLDILKHYTLVDTTHLSQLSTGGSNGDLKRLYLKVPFGLLLDPHGNLDISAKSPEQQTLEIFDVASELSMPFCRSMVQQIFESDSVSAEYSTDGLSAALLSAIKSALEKDQPSALELLATLDSALTNKIRQQAEREIIDASSFLTAPPIEPQSFGLMSPALVQKYLAIIDLTAGEASESTELSTMSMALIERIKGVAQALTSLGSVGNPHTHTDHLTVSDLYTWANALFRVLISHCTSLVGNATHQHQTALMTALKSLIVHPLLELYPHIAEHIFDVTVVLSDLLSDDVRIQLARAETITSPDDPRFSFIVGSAAPIDGWLVLTKPVNPPQPAQNFAPSQPQTPATVQSQYQSPQTLSSGASSPQRYFNPQQQRQQQMQAQQLRSYPQYPQHTHPQNKMLPAQLQRNPSNPSNPTPLQQMQHMQHMQSLAQQRATQPSPVQSQRPTPLASGPGATNGKISAAQAKEMRQFPYVQPRWEILAESSGNPNANETAINLTLFGARRA